MVIDEYIKEIDAILNKHINKTRLNKDNIETLLRAIKTTDNGISLYLNCSLNCEECPLKSIKGPRLCIDALLYFNDILYNYNMQIDYEKRIDIVKSQITIYLNKYLSKNNIKLAW